MHRTPVNPWDWGLQFSMNQGEVVEGATRHLHCSGQVALSPLLSILERFPDRG